VYAFALLEPSNRGRSVALAVTFDPAPLT